MPKERYVIVKDEQGKGKFLQVTLDIVNSRSQISGIILENKFPQSYHQGHFFMKLVKRLLTGESPLLTRQQINLEFV